MTLPNHHRTPRSRGLVSTADISADPTPCPRASGATASRSSSLWTSITGPKSPSPGSVRPGIADAIAATCARHDSATPTSPPPAPDVELSQPAELVSTVYGETRRQPGTRRLDKPPTITITVDLTTADTHRGRLAATGSAAAAILQWFGLPEATQIAPDGTVRTAQWAGGNQERRIAAWADAYDIPHER